MLAAATAAGPGARAGVHSAPSAGGTRTPPSQGCHFRPAPRALPCHLYAGSRPCVPRGQGTPTVARSQSEERTHQKAADAMHQLDVLKRERAASQHLRAELEARTAALINLEQQLQHMEAQRNTEAEATVARFHEFAQALALAERSMHSGDTAAREQVLAVEAKLAEKEREVTSLQQQLTGLQQQQRRLMEQAALDSRKRGGSEAEAGELRRRLQEQQNVLEEAAASAEAAEAERAALEQQVSLLREQAGLLSQQLQKRDAEAALQQRELEASRNEATGAMQRLAQLREAVAAEAAATAQVLDKAEAAARMLGEQLLGLMQSREAAGEEEEEGREARLQAAGEEGLSFLSESDADALLDELDFLQQQLGKQQALMEDAIRRANAAEKEAAELRERVLSSAAAATASPGPAVAAMYNSDLERQFAEATTVAAAAEAEAEALAVQNQSLQAEVKRLRDEAAQKIAAAASAAAGAGPGTSFGSASASQLAAALERVAALERQNAELRDGAAKKDAVLAESRKFIQSYLQRSATSYGQRHAAVRDAAPAPSSKGPSSAPSARPGTPPAQPAAARAGNGKDQEAATRPGGARAGVSSS